MQRHRRARRARNTRPTLWICSLERGRRKRLCLRLLSRSLMRATSCALFCSAAAVAVAVAVVACLVACRVVAAVVAVVVPASRHSCTSRHLTSLNNSSSSRRSPAPCTERLGIGSRCWICWRGRRSLLASSRSCLLARATSGSRLRSAGVLARREGQRLRLCLAAAGSRSSAVRMPSGLTRSRAN
ncbi:hypothetical protein BC831DRAFT_470364 [Entophlyctis helioformis]|nr:hypothetical protein BC831DRAFT_470364 [Entophlyctis helioformis]